MIWGNPVERERRNRILVSVAAYAYEMLNVSIMSDEAFDNLAAEINPGRSTGHPGLDTFFRKHFNPYTGMWIRQHPDLPGLQRVYDRHWSTNGQSA